MGESVFFDYEGTLNVCDQIENVVKDLKSCFEQIRQLFDEKDSVWKGEAANRFWEQYIAKGKDFNLDEMDNITIKTIPELVNGVRELVEMNRKVDSDIMAQTFMDANVNDNIQANEANVDARGVDTDLFNSVHTEDNIQANDAEPGAEGVNTTLNNETHANDNIQANTADVNAEKVDTQIITDTHTNDNIQANTADVNADKVDTELYNKVGTSGTFVGTGSADTSSAAEASSSFNSASQSVSTGDNNQ